MIWKRRYSILNAIHYYYYYYIQLHSLGIDRLDTLIQLLHTVHGKQMEFTTELVAILQRESLLQHVNLSKTNNDLLRDKENLAKELKL